MQHRIANWVQLFYVKHMWRTQRIPNSLKCRQLWFSRASDCIFIKFAQPQTRQTLIELMNRIYEPLFQWLRFGSCRPRSHRQLLQFCARPPATTQPVLSERQWWQWVCEVPPRPQSARFISIPAIQFASNRLWASALQLVFEFESHT